MVHLWADPHGSAALVDDLFLPCHLILSLCSLDSSRISLHQQKQASPKPKHGPSNVVPRSIEYLVWPMRAIQIVTKLHGASDKSARRLCR